MPRQLPGLYVHVPFCSSVCPYCDFAVLIAGDERRRPFPSLLRREMAIYRELPLRFDTVYLGGGTPSSLAAAELAEILSSASDLLNVEENPWIYLEVNPEDVTMKSAVAWRRLGVRTVSLGVQSFDDEVLAFLGRRHDRRAAVNAVDCLKGAGFHTVSADLIYGIPGQTAESWRRQLEIAVALELDHLSCYQLTVHRGTVFGRRQARGELSEMTDDAQAELFLLTHGLLTDAGLTPYEVSSFAADVRHRSRHNIKYWTHVPYLGLGPSAHSFVDGRRWWNRRKLRLWQRALEQGISAVQAEETLSREQTLLEVVMLGMRTPDGVDVDAIRREFGIDVMVLNASLMDRLEKDDLIRVAAGRLQPTVRGMCVADSLAAGIRLI